MTNSGSPVKGQLGRLSQAQAGDRGQTSRGSGFPEGLLRAPEVLGTLRTPWEGEWPTAYNMCVLLEIRRCLLTGPFFKLEPSWINKASKSENLHFSQIQPDFHWRPCCGFKTRLESSPKLQAQVPGSQTTESTFEDQKGKQEQRHWVRCKGELFVWDTGWPRVSQISKSKWRYPVQVTVSRWHSTEEFSCNARDAGDVGSIPGSGRPPGERNSNPLQHSCLGNLMDRGTWRATVHLVAKSWTRLGEWADTYPVQEAKVPPTSQTGALWIPQGPRPPCRNGLKRCEFSEAVPSEILGFKDVASVAHEGSWPAVLLSLIWAFNFILYGKFSLILQQRGLF